MVLNHHYIKGVKMALSQKQKRFLDKELKRIKKKNMNELRRWRKLRKKEIAKNKRKNKNG
tara:strand:+ start:194 stop:373 length:180 start_codon:yes stop_codon:yes gene_type:complete